MRVLITGGAGFIGSHLAEAYLRRGDQVCIVDDLSTGSLDNIRDLERDANVARRLSVTIDTVLNRRRLLELTDSCGVVYHLAAAVGVRYVLDNPLTSIVTNVQGTQTVLDVCSELRRPVLVASTSEVYGKHPSTPLTEDDDCVYGPSVKSRWSYAATKLVDEFMALAHHRTAKLPVVIARLFNTVGPRQTGRYGMVIPRFVQQALVGEPILVYGDGTQTRTFTHVRDTVSSLMRLIETADAFGEVVNIGGTEEVSILNLASRIKEKLGSRSEIRLIPYHEVFPTDFEDVQRRVPSTEKLLRLTGQSPTSKLDEILDDVIAYQRARPPATPRAAIGKAQTRGRRQR